MARLLTAACLTAGLAALALRPTGAGADTFPVTGSWYWANQPQPAPPPVGQPLGNVQPPDVPSSDFAVSVQGGSSEKETYLHIDTSTIPAGSTVSSFVLTLNEDSTAPGDGLAAQAAVKAYAATAFFADGAAARPYGERPPYDAKGPSATGKRDTGAGGGQATGAKWTFDLTQIVNAWLSGTVQNNGVALVGDAGQSQNFEVVWAGPTTNPSVAPPPKAEGTVTPGASGGAPPVPVENAGSGSATPSSGSGASPAVTVPVSTSGPGIPAIDQPVAPPANHASPPLAAPAPAPAPRARRASSHRAPPAGLWVAGLGAILLGLACMAVLGPGGEPGGRRRGSVLRALERRAAQGGVGPGTTDPVTGGAAS
jgi:hypothetical protein